MRSTKHILSGVSPGYTEGLRRSENPRRTRRSPRARGPEYAEARKVGMNVGVLNEVNQPEADP